MGRIGKTIVGLAIIAILVIGGLQGYQTYLAPETPTPTPLVENSEAVPIAIAIEGRLVPEKEATLSFRFGGRVSQLLVSEGDEVTADQVLMQLETADLEANVAQAEAALAAAKAQEAITPDDADQEVKDLAAANVAQAEAALEAALVALNEATLRAPFAGTVASIQPEVGEVLPPGVPAIVIADLSHWYVETLDLREEDAVQISVGQPVQIKIAALPDQILTGTVSHMALSASSYQGNVTYDARVAVENPAGAALNWGMTAYLEILPGQPVAARLEDPVPAATPSAAATEAAPVNSAPATATATATAVTPAPSPASATLIREQDGMPMVQIPATTFMMGARTNEAEAATDERPLHQVTLDSFYIDQYEVSVAQYAAFLNQLGQYNNACRGSTCLATQFETVHSYLVVNQGSYEAQPGYEQFPINNVSWYGAQAYCEWVGAQLPSEAEWELAARGTDDRLYPWGNEPPDEDRAIFNFETTHFPFALQPVNSHEPGSSPFDVYNMAGGVWEWVADTYIANGYTNGNGNPSNSAPHVLRGGGYTSPPADLRISNRHSAPPDETLQPGVGFRCARPLNNDAASEITYYRVVSVAENDVLNVRNKPGINNSIVGILPPNTAQVVITGPGQTVDGSLWVPIQSGTVTGWVNRTFLASMK